MSEVPQTTQNPAATVPKTKGLTPELSRADERPRRWDNLSASAEAAKRTRLERFVRCHLVALHGRSSLATHERSLDHQPASGAPY